MLNIYIYIYMLKSNLKQSDYFIVSLSYDSLQNKYQKNSEYVVLVRS